MSYSLKHWLLVSVKAALAASVAWSLVQPLGGVADDYPYYAPLGAVIAVTSTVASSIRESLHGLAAIAAGALLSLATILTPLPVVVDLALVVGIGSFLAGSKYFGNKAGWVPISALFVLIIGHDDVLTYALAYLGLTALGTVVGIALNVAFPPMALTPMTDSVSRLRDLLASQLDDLSEGLLREEPLTEDEWKERQRSIRPSTEGLQREVDNAAESRRANWRARRWDETTELRYQQARALQHVAFLIEDMTALLVEHERSDLETVALGPRVRPYAAHALMEMAEVLRSVEGHTAAKQELCEADDALGKLIEAIREERSRSETDLFAAGTVVVGVRRALAPLVPEDLRSELPSNW